MVLSERSGLLTAKTDDGSQLSIAANASGRHGHRVSKIGEEVSLALDENNTVIDVHPKGEEGTHQFVTGKLKYVGKMKKEITLETPDGNRVFPLWRLEVKTGTLEEGALVGGIKRSRNGHRFVSRRALTLSTITVTAGRPDREAGMR